MKQGEALHSPLRALCASVLAGLFLALAAPAGAHADSGSVAHLLSHGVDPAVPGLRARVSPRAAAAEAGGPSSWCGREQARDDLSHELANGDYRYHGVYLIPADGTDRFAALATQMQADAFGASGLLERLYGRAIRFDMGTSCGSDYLDISVIRTSLTSADFARAAKMPNGTLRTVAGALAAAGFPTLRSGAEKHQAAALRRNYVVWLDAPSPAGCGVAQVMGDATRRPTNWNNYGGKVAVVFRSGDGFCGPAALRHEIGHTLGALQPDAPHAFDGTHCNDAYEDTMCYPSSPVQAGGEFENQYFDYGNDDYWDPPQGRPLGWWTVNLNRFVCTTATCNTVADAETVAATPVAVPRSSRGTSHKGRAHRRRIRN